MTIGDKVKHRLSGQKMTVLRMNETVATCRGPKQKWKFHGIDYEHDRYVCLLENLTPINQRPQLKLF